MRVIAGTAKGRKLKTLEGRNIRPTTAKVKEAIFSAIQFDIPGAIVLDLFAGSGQMGIEALSRQADYAVFVDRSAKALTVTRENLETLHMLHQAQLIQSDAVSFLHTTNLQFGIAILDPPYHQNTLQKILPLLEQHIIPDGLILCEHETNLVLSEKYGSLLRKRQYIYGKITVTLYQKSNL